MDVVQLRTVIHVAELGSLSKAADRLHIAQPALSRQIRLLEEELGAPLFRRHGRGMVATDAGRDVLQHAIRIMAELEEIRAAVANESAPLRGHVAIGMPPTVADLLSEPLVSAFRDAHPEATLRIVSAFSGHLLDWLHRGEVDTAVIYDPGSTRTLRVRPLLEETLFVIGPKGAGLSPDAPIDFARLARERLLLPSRGHGLRVIVERCARECDVTLDIPVEADSYSALKHLVANGHGMTVLPLAPIHEELRDGRLSAAPLVNPVPTRRLATAFPAASATSRLARFAEQSIATAIERLVAEGRWSGRLLLNNEDPRSDRNRA